MKAIRMYRFGGPEVLELDEIDDPKPDAGQARVAVRSAGVHLVDTTIRAGLMNEGWLANPSLPTIPGREVAGVVDSVGDTADVAWLGRRVVAHLGSVPGGYAELAVVGVQSLHALPGTMGDDDAVAMIGTGRTAIGVPDAAAITPVDTVLITGAGGGLGSLLVQAALGAGAGVVALASGDRKVERVAALGAQSVDTTALGWPDAVRDVLDGRQITVALDGVGGDTGASVLELVAPGGRVVLFGYASGAPTPFDFGTLYRTGVRVQVALGPHTFGGGRMRGFEERSLSAAADGSFVPLIQQFALADAAAAHAAIEERRTIGKVVLRTGTP